jgi:catechol 2,3-dioxygenase-like lactoylglutathione lyase family enzyme
MLRVNHVNIVVADMERSLAFYVGLLGLVTTFEVELSGDWIETVTGLPGVHARCVFCQPPGGGARFELLQYVWPAGEAAPSASLPNTRGLRHIAFEVDDLDETYARLSEAGVRSYRRPLSCRLAWPGRSASACVIATTPTA